MIAVLSGQVTIYAGGVAETETARIPRDDEDVAMIAEGDAMLLVMTGEPIDEPVFGHGLFAMESDAQIREPIAELNAVKFGALALA